MSAPEVSQSKLYSVFRSFDTAVVKAGGMPLPINQIDTMGIPALFELMARNDIRFSYVGENR